MMLKILLNVVLPLVIAGAVGHYFYTILSRPELRETQLTLRFEWLIPATLLYLVAHSIWGAYWVTLLRNQGLQVSYPLGWRGYFVSQFGKYIPGKVWVILIRVAMLHRVGANRAIVGVTATYETLISMGAGAMLGAILLPLVASEKLGIGNLSAWLIPMALLPLGLGLINRLVTKISAKRRGPDAPPFPKVSMLMLIRGLLQASVGWLLLGLSLWMTIQGLQPETTALTGEMFLRLTAINAMAYVLGFIAIFMPAGGGVREFALQKLLALEFAVALGESQAVIFAAVVSLVLRLLWTVAELGLALILQRALPLPK
jgi:uncharacterized membrane protein YbhN (UPF0104 family)